jgi:hypothetical protein
VNLDGDTAAPTLFISEVRNLDGRHIQWSWLVRLLGRNRPEGHWLGKYQKNGYEAKEPYHTFSSVSQQYAEKHLLRRLLKNGQMQGT